MNTLKQPQQSGTRRIAIHKHKVSNKQHKLKMAIQRVCGTILLIIGIISAIISNDSTVMFLLIPLALYTMLTKDYIMCF